MGETFQGLDLAWSTRIARDMPAGPFVCIGTSWKSLKRFSYTGRNPTSLSPLNIGNLEELGITCKSYYTVHNSKWKRVLNEVRENCPKLSAIILNDPLIDSEVAEDVSADFLASYGVQLVKAEVHRLNEENLGKVARSCENLRCFQYENENRFDRIYALGH